MPGLLTPASAPASVSRGWGKITSLRKILRSAEETKRMWSGGNGSQVTPLPKPSCRRENYGQAAKHRVCCRNVVSKVATGLGQNHASAPARVPPGFFAEYHEWSAVGPPWSLSTVLSKRWEKTTTTGWWSTGSYRRGQEIHACCKELSWPTCR